MASIVITIKDGPDVPAAGTHNSAGGNTPDGIGMQVSVQFNPPMKKGTEPSPGQRLGMHALDSIKDVLRAYAEATGDGAISEVQAYSGKGKKMTPQPEVAEALRREWNAQKE